MRFFASSQRASSTPSTTSRTWSIICFLVVLNSFLSILSPSTAGGRALAALDPGFCGDCQTFSNAIGVCGGTFTNKDIEINGEYVLQQPYSKCICSDVMQKALWTCAKCELLAGFQSKAPPPQKYQTQCIAWGMTIQEWRAPYTGTIAPGTQTDMTGGGGTNPPPPPNSSGAPTGNPTGPTSAAPTGKPSGTDSSTSPSSSGDSGSGDGSTESGSGPNTPAIAISVSIIGVALIAGSLAVVMMKRRRRRHTPLDLDSLPGVANFVSHEDKWDKSYRPTSPPLASAPVASATPAVIRGGHRSPYDGRGYMEGGSVVGGYDAQYDAQYDGYDKYNNGGYGHGQYANHQYDEYGQYDQNAYPMHEYNGYDHNAPTSKAQGGQYYAASSKADEPAKYL
ncbi:hypothetical protein BGX27_001786 [Mortierella sp. AM989]|nr:hypothetical protein BGX27_001786 [Mortierella sp. AM989]